MAITSNLKNKGYKIEGGTTLIKIQPVDKPYKWIKTVIEFQDYTKLKKIAISRNTSLTKLVREAVNLLLKRIKKGGEILY